MSGRRKKKKNNFKIQCTDERTAYRRLEKGTVENETACVNGTVENETACVVLRTPKLFLLNEVFAF